MGREREVAAVADLLAREGARLVTLTGPGGAGKTRLALRVAEEVAPSFPDGVVFVGLEVVADPALVLPTVARAFAVREAGDVPVARRLGEVVRDGHVLVLLDSFEHVVEAAPAVAELLVGSAGATVLVTSRTPLQVSGEQEYPVPPLPVPQAETRADRLAEAAAVRLFAERARAVDPAFVLTPENVGTIAAICRRLDGLPLALELAAAKIRLLPPEALLVRLERRLPVLTGGARDQPVRLRTMRDAVAWSHDLLAAAEQTLFRRLAVFVGGFEAEAAEAVAVRPDVGDLDLFSGVEALVDHSLVRRLEPVGSMPRFGMLETIREFGLECLQAAEGEEVRRAHAAHYLSVAQRAEPELLGPHPEAWLARLTADHGNLVAALGFFAEADTAAGARLAGALREYWYASGRWVEGRGWLEAAVARADELPDEVAGKAHVAAGFLAHYQGDDSSAVPRLERGRELLRRAGDEREEAYAEYLLGVAAEDRGEYAAAGERLGEVADRLRRFGDATNAAYCEAHLGIVALGEGDWGRAAAHGQAALAVARAAGSRDAGAVALLLLGDTARDAGDLDAAAARYREYLQSAATPGGIEDLERVVASVAVLVARRGQWRRAARLLGASERLREAVGLALALPERAACERAGSEARAVLGDDAFDRAVSEGGAMTPAEALAEVERALGMGERASAAQEPGVPAAAGLSPREAEVLRLLAAGRTNREIADALFLSVRTVERHVTNLYAKIGARGRADATAFALRTGLA